VSKSLKQIMRGVLPENQQRDLRESQRDFVQQLSATIGQMELQAEATFNGRPWSEVSWPELTDRWEALIKAQIALLAKLKAGTLPEWKVRQDAAYADSAIRRLLKGKGRT
jgi:hypothetical protein